MTEYRVIKNREVDTGKPIKLQKNQTVQCLEESDSNGEWPNWIYCKAGTQEGWVPKQIIMEHNHQSIVSEDYDATEIAIKIGEIVIGKYQLNNWVWGSIENHKQEGWFPLNHLERL